MIAPPPNPDRTLLVATMDPYDAGSTLNAVGPRRRTRSARRSWRPSSYLWGAATILRGLVDVGDYSWNRDAWAADPWARNSLGTLPQGRADYAFLQHVLASLNPDTGRCAILFPHGVLFRNEERDMRRRLIESDRLDCVLGLGPNLFFNSPMEACVGICRSRKPPERQGRVLFIDAVNAIAREGAYSFLPPEHQQRIARAYRAFADAPAFARVADLGQIADSGYSLSIPLYVKRGPAAGSAGVPEDRRTLAEAWDAWEQDGREFWQQMDALIETLDGLVKNGQEPAGDNPAAETEKRHDTA